MLESDITDWYEAGKKIITQFYKDYNYKRFQPFIHGTSTYHLEHIKKGGLCPRGERHSVWEGQQSMGGGSLASPRDKVYFGQCQDWLSSRAANEAVHQADRIMLDEYPKLGVTTQEQWDKVFESKWKMKRIGFKGEPKAVFLKLKNFEKYKKFIDRDTDENWLKELDNKIFKSIYAIDNPNQYPTLSETCYPRVDKKLINVMDVLWTKCGWSCVRKIIKDDIPPAIKSLYSGSRSISFDKCSINPDDLEVEGKRECPDLKIDGGCSEKGKELKEKYKNALYKNHYTYSAVRDNTYAEHKEELNKNIEKTKKELVEYIQETKVPTFLKMLEALN